MKILFLTLAALFLLTLSANSQVFGKKTSKFIELEYLQGDTTRTVEQSREIWNEMKEKNGNSYIYHTGFTSWVGFGYRTEIKVEDGVVTERKYESFQLNHKTNKTSIKESWVETGDEIGKHDEGNEPLTIDQLYGLCIGKYLKVDEENNTLYFYSNDEGVITTCGYYPHGCADDCFEGITIFGFKWLNED